MPNPTYQLPRDSTMQGIVTQLQAIAANMSGSGGSSSGSGGGSGTTVVANPSGTATGDLTSIQIGNDIYDIPVGSSSGGSGYEATLIYDGSALSSLQSSIELDEEWDNYDAIVFAVNFASNQSKTSVTFYKDMLTANIGKIVGIAGFATVYAGATVNSDKKTFSNIYGGGDIQNIYGVYGLKFGAGGGSSSGGSGSSGTGTARQVDHIYTNSTREIQDTVTLLHPYTDYDYLVIEISDIAQYAHRRQSMVFLKEQLDDAKDNGGYITYYQSANAYAEYAVTNTTTLTKDRAAYECITDIYGVKEGSGGSSSSQEEYSTTEKVIGKWIDGKPVYQKTFAINLHTNGTVWVDTGCTIPNIEHIIDWSIVCEDTYVSGAPANIKTCSFRYYNGNIQISGNTEWYLDLQAITIKYTKTTD